MSIIIRLNKNTIYIHDVKSLISQYLTEHTHYDDRKPHILLRKIQNYGRAQIHVSPSHF